MNKKLTGIIIALSAIIITFIVIIVLSDSDSGSKKLRSMSSEELLYEYQGFLDEYKNTCNDTAAKYTGVDINNTYPVAGNSYWWTTLNSTAKDTHTPIYSSSNGFYGLAGEMGKSRYFVTGLMFFFQGAIGEEIYWSRIQENIINALLDTDDFRAQELTIYVNDTNWIEFPKYLKDYGIGENITIISGENLDLTDLDYDLFMASNPTQAQIEDATSKGIPMYVSYNHNWAKDNYTYELFNVTLSGSPKDLITTNNCEGSLYKDMSDIYNILDVLVNGKLELIMDENWSCEKALETDSSCDFDNVIVKNSNSTSIMDFYYTPVRKLRNIIKEYDKKDIDIFSLDYNYDIRLSLAIAENFRENVTYDAVALDYTTTLDHTEFYRTMFADTIINYAADDNVVSNSLGKFSPNEDQIQLLETHNETITIDKLFGKKATSTGIYIKAGQETTITRLDDEDYNLTLYINYQNDIASQIYSKNAYNRPYTDRSNAITIRPGESYTVSTPKGGTAFFVNQSSATMENIQISFENILNNPYLDEFDDKSIEDFALELITTPFNYVDVITPHIQLHSTTSNMLQAFDNFDGGPKAYIGALLTYWGEVNYTYGGFIGDGVPARSEEIDKFFEDMDLTAYANDTNIHERGPEQSYSDRASCGYMCATGDMTDSPAPFDPFGWGESHELGHKMQNYYTKIYNGASGEVSNNIYPMEVARQRAKDLGETYYIGHGSYNNKNAFNAVVEGYGNVSSSNHLWSSGGMLFNRLAVYQQMTYAAGDDEFFTKMSILARILTANSSGENFLEIKDRLGFSTYESSSSITGNDFMAITGSIIADRDLSGFFEGMGIAVSDKAKTQIQTVTYSKPKIDGKYYFVPGKKGDYRYTPVDFINYSNIDDYLIDISSGIWENPTI